MWPSDVELSKRQLGLAYVGGTGVVFSGVLLGRLVITGPAGFSLVATLASLVPALSLASASYFLTRIGLDDEQVWSVAKWGALGIGLLTLLNTGVVLVDYYVAPVLNREMGFFMSNVAAGAIAGVLVGGMWELHKTTRRLNQRNVVLNRVLRHNVRNDMNVILGHTELLEAELGATNDRIEAIKEKGHGIVDLTEKARLVEQVFDRDGHQCTPVDVVSIVERRVESIRAAHPDALVEADLAAEAWAWADDLLEAALDNLLENSVEHNDGPPQIGVTVEQDDGAVTVRITDNAPPIPDSELSVLSSGRETPLHHGSGLGLWLVHWLVASYDGSLSFEQASDGNVVLLSLRAAAGLRQDGGDPSADTDDV